MKPKLALLLPILLALTLASASAAVRYVNLANPSPAPPYTNWATAAENIQSAVDAASAGEEIVVTNGVYATGGRAVFGIMTNRVAVTKPVIVRSVNGPEVTMIRGYQVPSMTNGVGAVRCVYLANGATLVGFTLTNGATLASGDREREQSGGGLWCASSGAFVDKCVIVGNAAAACGGGAYVETYTATLSNCTIRGNSAGAGGGVCGGNLKNCSLTGNASYLGGGAFVGTLNNCTLSGNRADEGGGAAAGTLNNCTLTGNSATSAGGGVYGATLNNCMLAQNSAREGAGASGGTLNNCTVTDNSGGLGGGAEGCWLTNCIVFFNTPSNYFRSTFSYSCTTPLTDGVGNIETNPQLTPDGHLSPSSPCIGAGSPDFVNGTDIDGEPWANPPCMGADQRMHGNAVGPLSINIVANYSRVGVGYPVTFAGRIWGPFLKSVWDFGDGTGVTNQDNSSHSWNASGTYTIHLIAYNDSFPNGVETNVLVEVSDAVHHVNQSNSTPIYPFTSWATAATTIQEAVDAALPGAIVLATNGVYGPVVVTQAVAIRSLKGPSVTIIDGGGTARCVYLGGSGAAVSGFTLTHGVADTGGGVSCLDTTTTVSNCIIVGNRAWSSGGGTEGGTLENCTITGNSAHVGGGACGLDGNNILNNCILTSNSAELHGGGAAGSTLNNCTISGNSAKGQGGGSWVSTLRNCTVTGNSAEGTGGGIAGGHSCPWQCIDSPSFLTNCIVYYNHAPSDPNYSVCIVDHSCTTPLPPGLGNIDAEPQLASSSHLSADSPCRGAGSAAYATGLDIDGEAWANPPSIGCDEFHAGAVTGSLSVGFTASYTNVVPGFEVNFAAQIIGPARLSRWEFGDGVIVSNRLDASHRWAGPGDYQVVLIAYNDTYPGGVSASATVHVLDAVYYVALSSTNPVRPYSSWDTAATNIQDGVDAAAAGGVVLVANGVYQSGGDGENRVVVTKPLTLRSLNGPDATVIDGKGAMRCVMLGEAVALTGFKLTNGNADVGGGVLCHFGHTAVSNCILVANMAGSGGGASRANLDNCTLAGNSAGSGGGASDCTLSHCTLTGNSAGSGGGADNCVLNNCRLTSNFVIGYGSSGGGAFVSTLNSCVLTGNSADFGGGAFSSTLNNCSLIGNLAIGSVTGGGGGAYAGRLNNCSLTGNSASTRGGGAFFSTLNNCVVYFNTSPDGPNYYNVTLSYCCTTPTPTSGFGNITDAPLFVDRAGGNLSLQSNSPCINAGRNADTPVRQDLDGNPRIAGGTVDIGAYEFQNPASTLSYAWLQQFGLPLDGSADFADPDGDDFNNYQEWRAGTDPISPLSALRLLTPSFDGIRWLVSWQSVPERSYTLERRISLSVANGFLPVATTVPGQSGTTTLIDTNSTAPGPTIYRVRVEE